MGWRTWTIVAAALSLGGCNMVVSKKPLFTLADTRDTPVFRAGVWAKDDPACTFDPAAPRADWPECAGSTVVPAGQGVLRDDKGGEMLIASGDPLILQIRPVMEGGKIAGYLYGAARITAWDDQRRVIGVEAWPVLCGPPPPPGPDGVMRGGKPEDFVTRKPLPGLKIEEGNCVATDPKVVRNAARASPAWETPQRNRWIRDGEQ